MPVRRWGWLAGDLLASAILALTGLAGLANGPTDLREAETYLQRVVGVSVIVYGVSGLLAAFGLWLRARWTLPVMVIWGAGGTLAATTASVAYSPEVVSWWQAALGGLAAAAISGAVIWYAARSWRR